MITAPVERVHRSAYIVASDPAVARFRALSWVAWEDFFGVNETLSSAEWLRSDSSHFLYGAGVYTASLAIQEVSPSMRIESATETWYILAPNVTEAEGRLATHISELRGEYDSHVFGKLADATDATRNKYDSRFDSPIFEATLTVKRLED